MPRSHDHIRKLRLYTLLLILAWTLVVLLSIIWRINQEHTARFHQAREIARSHLEKDLILREWNIKHGFVYVPVTPENQPNPHLRLPEREIISPSGKVFTAINSSLLIRQIYELAAEKLSYRGHLTSLQPLRPENAPDPWEKQALEQMLAGSPEVSGIVTKEGQLYFRLMQPLPVSQKCLDCHADYTIGQIAGGISVALPLATVATAWQHTTWAVCMAHGFLWLVGILGVVFASRKLENQIKAQHQIETALRQSEKNYRLLVQTIPALVYRGYADGRVEFVDNKVESVTGYKKEDFASGRLTWPEIIVPEDRLASKKIFLQALKGNGAYRREYRIRRQNGDLLWLAERSQIILDEKGRIDFISGVVIDISLQKEMERSLQESERFWKSILDAVGVGVMVINKENGLITEVNPRAAAMIGQPKETIIGQTRETFFFCSVSQEKRDTGTHGSEGKLRRADNSLLPIWKTAAPIKIGKVAYVLVSFVDLTEQHRAELALLETNRELQTAVAKVEQTNREISLIGKMVELLQICESPEEAFPIIGQFAGALFPDLSGGLYLLNSSNNLLALVIPWGHIQGSESVFNPGDCWALRQGRPYACGTSQGSIIHPRCHHITKNLAGNYLCMPLTAQNETLGLLYFENTREDEDGVVGSRLKLARTFAEHISLSLANLKLRETLRHQAIRDSLTGLYNRRYLMETLDREIARAHRRDTGLGVIMLDVDHFKRFNDTHGHEAGDRLLAILGRYLQGVIRAEDIACRYGGEEFTLILPEITVETLLERAEKIRAGVRELEVLHQGRLLGEITISLGISYFPQHGRDGESLLQAADAALYQAKRAGRNQVVMAGCAWQSQSAGGQAA